MCYHAEFGRSALKGVGKNTRIGDRWNSALLGWEAWLTPTFPPPPHVCCHVKFGSSATKGVRINRKKPQNWGALGHRPLAVGAWLTPRNTLLPTRVTCHIWSFEVKRYERENLTPRVPPFKVTQGHRKRYRSIRHLWFLVNVLYGPISYRFRDKRQYQSKIANFPHPTCILRSLGIG